MVTFFLSIIITKQFPKLLDSFHHFCRFPVVPGSQPNSLPAADGATVAGAGTRLVVVPSARLIRAGPVRVHLQRTTGG
jgi:hypothetical protein